jgi:hypothetical protein
MRRLLILLPLMALAACSSSKKDLTVPLAFHPERERAGQYIPIAGSPGARLNLLPVADDRPDKTRIGENTELNGKPSRPILASGQSPAEFVGSILARELASAGLPAADPAQANRALQVRLTEFFTTESTRYNTSVRAAVELRDASGGVLWSAPIIGQSDRFGNSLSPENYNEGFSDATLQLAQQIINNPGFRKAVIPE